jgi:CheY-like chemotaxis protein
LGGVSPAIQYRGLRARKFISFRCLHFELKVHYGVLANRCHQPRGVLVALCWVSGAQHKMEAQAPLIVVVDDEPLVRDLIVTALEDGGFEVKAAGEGREAIALLEQHGASVMGVVTDIRLGGGCDGWQVAQRGRELNPTLAVIYTTGDSEVEWASKGVPRSTLVVKPFAPTQLVVALANLLNEQDPARG